MSRFDIVLFGATGYTGQFIAKELAKRYKEDAFTWAVAGRSQQKLAQLMAKLTSDLKSDLSSIELIIVDTNNAESIRKMCEKATLVLNCVGPYRFYGEQVVEQCVKSQTHHIDVSGEPEFLERMQLKYGQEARDKNVYIIGSCGFDSIPAEMGMVFTKNNFPNQLNHVESYLTFDSGIEKLKVNFGTYESAVHGIASASSLKRIRKELFKTRLPKSSFKPAKKTKYGFFYDDVLKKYCFDFLGSDKSIVQRTEYYNYENLDKRPVQFIPYFTVDSLCYAFMFILFGLMFAALASFEFGRKVLLKHYKIFSAGLVSKDEPDINKASGIQFRMQFRGVGFSKPVNKDENPTEPPVKEIVTEVCGPDGYTTTTNCVYNSAIVFLKEKSKLPKNGGVYTPASAFCNTTLIERLIKDGMTFKVISR